MKEPVPLNGQMVQPQKSDTNEKFTFLDVMQM